ncbi:MAG: hypothetical protein ACREL9_09720 [Gemmatimonadales bacterium]
MHGCVRTSLLLPLTLALAGLRCAFPDDTSTDVYVTLEYPQLVVLDGEEMTIRARAWRRVGDPDSGTVDDQALGNVDFLWTSSSGSVARVENTGAGSATVFGLAPGITDITARVVSFENASASTVPLRVSAFLEIDSMTPPSIKWGDKLTLWGVGVQFAFLVTMTGQALIPDTLTFVESNGFSHMEFWVPQPARTSELFVLGPGVFFSTPDSVTVDTVDLYEPNTTAPSQISLDGPGPYPTKVPEVLFFNPALAFEDLPRDTTTGYDWYRFARTDPARPLTFILRPQGLTDSAGLFMVVADSIFFAGGAHQPAAGPTWFVTSEGLYRCSRGDFAPAIVPFDSIVIALLTLPRYVPGNNGLHALNLYSKRFNYTMAAVDAYITADPRLGPDRFEENDICTMADDPAKIIPVAPAAPFTDTLNIDNPHELDWLRFRVTALAGDSTMIRVRSRPFGSAVGDRSDIDLYVLDTTLAFVGAVADVGSRDSIRLLLASGDYYLALVDFVGRPVRYSVCISVRQACVPPTFPGDAPAASGPRVSRFRAGTGDMRPDGRPFSAPAGSTRSPPRSPFRRP